MKKIAFIGSGPSSLMGAFLLSKKGFSCTIFEREAEIGKRLKISGNGRCNLFHHPLDFKYYKNQEFAKKYMEEFLLHEQEIFNELGLLTFDDEEGRTYPLSKEGKQVISLFMNALKRNGVNIIYKEVKNIINLRDGVKIYTENEEYVFDECVFAIGGFSYRYPYEEKLSLCQKMNLSLTPLSPSLTPIKTSSYHNKNLEGRRYQVLLSLTKDHKQLFTEKGEILFKKDGISGIVTFNLSSVLARLHLADYKGYQIHIDFLPNISHDELKKIIYHPSFPLEENLERLLGKELQEEWMYWMKNKKKDLFSLIKDYTLDVISLYPLKDSQVTSGGINLSSLNKDGSLIHMNHVFPCGEILDIDGASGGYNIAFAFGSAYFVCQSIICRLKK